MSERRPDHFAYLKYAPAAPLPDKDAPTVRPDLVEWLEAQFPVGLPSPAATQDDLVFTAADVARQHGEQRVIAAIRNLIRGA